MAKAIMEIRGCSSAVLIRVGNALDQVLAFERIAYNAPQAFSPGPTWCQRAGKRLLGGDGSMRRPTAALWLAWDHVLRIRSREQVCIVALLRRSSEEHKAMVRTLLFFRKATAKERLASVS